jgi:hypothetical protein
VLRLLHLHITIGVHFTQTRGQACMLKPRIGAHVNTPFTSIYKLHGVVNFFTYLDVSNIVAGLHTDCRWKCFKCWQASPQGDTTLPGRATRKRLAHDRPSNDRKETRFWKSTGSVVLQGGVGGATLWLLLLKRHRWWISRYNEELRRLAWAFCRRSEAREL